VTLLIVATEEQAPELTPGTHSRRVIRPFQMYARWNLASDSNRSCYGREGPFATNICARPAIRVAAWAGVSQP
jgi:hypothetical protein